MIGDSQWIEGFLYKVMARAAELINQQAQSFRDSLERWLALNWPILMLPGWEVRFNNFLRDWRADGVILQPESAQQLFDYLNAQSERMRAEGVQLPEQLPTWQSLLPTREQAMRPADERHFPDDLPAPFDPAYPQLRRTGNSIMQRHPPEGWLRRAEQVLKNYRVPEEIAKQFLAWIAAEQQKRVAPAVLSAAGLESFGPADLHPLAVCFAAGTPILTRCGPIAIEQVAGGDEVLAVPETDPLALARWCRVERAYHNNPAELIDIHVAGLPMIRATLNHPFFVWGKGFIAAQRLCTGDLLRTADDRWLPISETFRDGTIQPVYNLCVAGCHTYFAGGVLVHNQSPGPAAAAPPNAAMSEFTARAIEHAGLTKQLGADGSKWNPAQHTVGENRAVLTKIYSYYASLYFGDPKRFLWAGLAANAGKQVVMAVDELDDQFALVFSLKKRGQNQIAAVLTKMAISIFLDMGWQYEAYTTNQYAKSSPLGGIESGTQDGVLRGAWADIDSGDPARVAKGTITLTKREQTVTLSPGYNELNKMSIQAPGFAVALTRIMSMLAESGLAGTKSFLRAVPFGNLADVDQRWDWISNNVLPSWLGFSKVQRDDVVRQAILFLKKNP